MISEKWKLQFLAGVSFDHIEIQGGVFHEIGAESIVLCLCWFFVVVSRRVWFKTRTNTLVIRYCMDSLLHHSLCCRRECGKSEGTFNRTA